jgi:hypothetical protein
VAAKWILTVALLVGSTLITSGWDSELEAISLLKPWRRKVQARSLAREDALVPGAGAQP